MFKNKKSIILSLIKNKESLTINKPLKTTNRYLMQLIPHPSIFKFRIVTQIHSNYFRFSKRVRYLNAGKTIDGENSAFKISDAFVRCNVAFCSDRFQPVLVAECSTAWNRSSFSTRIVLTCV